MKPHTIVTSALPYANGPIHLGHLLEVIQTDMWCRFQRLRGDTCYYLCADDAHGTPVMLSAKKAGIEPADYIESIRQQHIEDFTAFGVHFDSYHSTHSKENQALTESIYLSLKDNDLISEKDIEQLFDPKANMFLPDRFVKGTCPKCKAPEQYGDNCDVCGATYSPTDLIEPQSVLSDATPVLKTTTHYFFDLPKLGDWLESWLKHAKLQNSVKAKLREWFEAGLKPWDISRDEPYFGFKIPGTNDKYFYVWLDAPIGYLASLKKLCDEQSIDFDALLQPDSDHKLIHFIGKDVVYFHALFWPAMLYGSGLKTPDEIAVHGFVTVNSAKMSKSKGTFIKASDFKTLVNPEYLRYYFASRLTQDVTDIDFDIEAFSQKINSDIVGKLVNLASRAAKMLKNQFDNYLSAQCDENWLQPFVDAKEDIAKHYQDKQFAQAIRRIMQLADQANQYVDTHKPWQMIKNDDLQTEVHQVLSTSINAFKILTAYLAPVMPELSAAAGRYLNTNLHDWHHANVLLVHHQTENFTPLATRIDGKKLQSEIDALKPKTEKKPSKTQQENKNTKTAHIDIQDFHKIELKVGTILQADHVEGADKLLQLQVDIGESKPRQIFAGIKSAYQPEKLIDKQVIVVANLAPRKMRFGLSEGMVVAAGPGGGEDIWLISPDAGAVNGMRVK